MTKKKEGTVKTDTVLKNFWRDNSRFADLFNAALFHGKQVIRPETLEELDTDLSAVLELDGQGHTVERILDVSKRSADGYDLVLLGLENQKHIHYGMPLRIMTGDTLSYLKQFEEIRKRNFQEKKLRTSGEYLSGFRREDRLHPVVTLCVYYGQTPWDGPCSLLEMLHVPETVETSVSDYRMHLIQVIESEPLKFKNEDVRTVFDVSRKIYQKEYDQLLEVYREKELSSELGLVVGVITESQELIRRALEQKEGGMNMCQALEEWMEENITKGMRLKLKQLIQRKLAKGKDAAEIAEILEEDEQVIRDLIREMQEEEKSA